MRHLIGLFLVIILSACATTHQVVNMPVYTPPKFDMPIRPTLRSNGLGEVGLITKNIELDLLDLKTYALQLENILIVIKSDNNTKQ